MFPPLHTICDSGYVLGPKRGRGQVELPWSFINLISCVVSYGQCRSGTERSQLLLSFTRPHSGKRKSGICQRVGVLDAFLRRGLIPREGMPSRGTMLPSEEG